MTVASLRGLINIYLKKRGQYLKADIDRMRKRMEQIELRDESISKQAKSRAKEST